MGFGTAFVLIVLIICITVLVGMHMDYCNENQTGLYADKYPQIEKRISRLEKIIETEAKKK